MYIKSYAKYVLENLAVIDQFDDWRKLIYDMCKLNFKFMNRSEQIKFIIYSQRIKDNLTVKYQREMYEIDGLLIELANSSRH